MIPVRFAYATADSADEAVALLREYGADGKLLAGGHSLIPMMKLRLASPSVLIDVGRASDLRGITRQNGTVSIGSGTTHTALEFDPQLAAACPLVPQVARVIGDRQVRNRGTIGGSLAHADPAADLPAAMLALDATLLARSPRGERAIEAGAFFVDLLTTALEPDELLTQIRVPALAARTGTAYAKFANPASGYALTGVAAVVTLAEDGTCREARVAVTGAGTRPVRARAVEAALAGRPLDSASIARAAEAAADGIALMGDIHASAEYRAHLCRVLATRALSDAARAATGAAAAAN